MHGDELTNHLSRLPGAIVQKKPDSSLVQLQKSMGTFLQKLDNEHAERMELLATLKQLSIDIRTGGLDKDEGSKIAAAIEKVVKLQNPKKPVYDYRLSGSRDKKTGLIDLNSIKFTAVKPKQSK
jgi:hypothetical protein